MRLPAICQRGRIELIMGCMFSGKTTELIRRCKLHEVSKKRVLKIKFAFDRRFGENGENIAISTHCGIQSSAVACTKLEELGDQFLDYEVIAVDEGHFFVDIVEFCENAANNGKIVVVSSLQGTF